LSVAKETPDWIGTVTGGFTSSGFAGGNSDPIRYITQHYQRKVSYTGSIYW